MSFNASTKINLHTAFTLAESIAKERSPKAKFILDHTVKKNKRGYLNLSYAYLRWVDDYVDDPKNEIMNKKIFIERQNFLIDSFMKNEEVEFQNTEETFLYHFIRFAKQNEEELIISALKNMIDSIEMDVRRLQGDGIFSASELELYVRKQSKALYDIIIYFFLPKKYHDIKNTQGRYQARAFILRDIVEDIDAGLINISLEDIQKFNLDLSSIRAKENLEPWIKEELGNILKLLFNEAEEAKNLPLKYKIFVYYSHIYYLPTIFRLKAVDYMPLKIKHKKSFFDEIKLFFRTFPLCIKLFRIEFLK